MLSVAAQPSPTIEMLILQSTPFCNIECAYCYLPDRTSHKRMSFQTLERALQAVFDSPHLSSHLTILWHAGEPLVPGVPYYDRAFEILDRVRPAGITIAHSFQTNGTLLSQEWVDFFKAHDVKVGLSIDGPSDLHDARRRTRAGGGTFERAMRGLRILQDNAVAFHVITVLTRDSIGSPRALFDFYVANGITKVAFNIEEIEGNHTSSSLSGEETDRDIRSFFSTFLDLIETRAAGIEVREFLGAFSAIANAKSAQYGNPLAQPLRIVSVAADGDISTFSPELLGYGTDRHGAFSFGNVHQNEISDVLANPRFLAVNSEIDRGLELCQQSCQYFEICRGGSPANKLFENGSFASTETLFCRMSKKAVIDVVLERMEKALDCG